MTSTSSSPIPREYPETYPAELKQKLDTVNHFCHHGQLYQALEIIDDLETDEKTCELLTDDSWVTSLKSQRKDIDDFLELVNASEDWELFKQGDVWTTYSKAEPDMDTHSFKVTGVVNDIPMWKLCAVVKEFELLKNWIPFCTDSIEIGWETEFCVVGRCVVSIMWPMTPREVIMRGFGVDDSINNNRVVIHFVSIDEHDQFEVPPETDAFVRPTVNVGGLLYERVSEDSDDIRITIVWNGDPKVYVPYTVLNFFTKHFVATLVDRMVNCARFDENSDYATRVAGKTDFYDRIRANLERKQKANEDEVAEAVETAEEVDVVEQEPPQEEAKAE